MDPTTVTDPYWWAQPAATILAAVIALAAAGIAWYGATSQAREATRRERVTNRIMALADVHAAAILMIQAGMAVRNEGAAEAHANYVTAFTNATVDRTKLVALGGYDTVVSAVDDVLIEISRS